MRLGFDDTQPAVVLAVTGASASRRALRSTARSFATAHGGLAGEIRDTVALVIPHNDADVLARKLHQYATQRLGEPQRLGRTDDAGSMKVLGFVGTLLGSRDAAGVAQYIDDVLGPLLNYDQMNGTQLVATLQSYFNHGRSLKAAAYNLSIHPNTVTQRLGRVSTLIGDDWQNPERALELQIALRLRLLL